MSSSGRVIIVTGAGNGIGLHIVLGLLNEPATALVVAVDIDTTNLEPLISQNKNRVEIVQGSVADRSTSDRAVEYAISLHGRLDTIILNAGILRPQGPLIDTKVDDWKQLFNVNFFSLLHTIQLAIPHLRKANGSIIMTSSGASLFPFKDYIPYACAKSTMNYLCSVLAIDEPEIASLCITPGIVETGMQKSIRSDLGTPPRGQLEHLEKHQNGRNLTPDQPAKTYVKLALGSVPEECRGEVIEWNDPRIAV